MKSTRRNKFIQRKVRPLLVLCLLAATPAAVLADKPVVLASIQPLAMITEAVVGDAFEVQTLLPASASPHSYTLKFSDRRQLQQADIVIWIGPELETVLTKLLDENALLVSELPELDWPEGEGNQAQSQSSGHKHGSKDLHLWLNPENALRIAEALADKLAESYPQRQETLSANVEIFSSNIAKMIDKTRKQAASVQNAGFLVVHDGYGQWVDYYQLRQLGSIKMSSGAEKGLKHRSELLAKKGEIQCVFSEPQWPLAWAEQLAKPLFANVGTLDPMGRDIVGGGNRYIRLMASMMDNFVQCVGATSGGE